MIIFSIVRDPHRDRATVIAPRNSLELCPAAVSITDRAGGPVSSPGAAWRLWRRFVGDGGIPALDGGGSETTLGARRTRTTRTTRKTRRTTRTTRTTRAARHPPLAWLQLPGRWVLQCVFLATAAPDGSWRNPVDPLAGAFSKRGQAAGTSGAMAATARASRWHSVDERAASDNPANSFARRQLACGGAEEIGTGACSKRSAFPPRPTTAYASSTIAPLIRGRPLVFLKPPRPSRLLARPASQPASQCRETTAVEECYM